MEAFGSGLGPEPPAAAPEAPAPPVRPHARALLFNGSPITITAELADELLAAGVADTVLRSVAGELTHVLHLHQGVCEVSDDKVRDAETLDDRGRGFVQKGWE